MFRSVTVPMPAAAREHAAVLQNFLFADHHRLYIQSPPLEPFISCSSSRAAPAIQEKGQPRLLRLVERGAGGPTVRVVVKLATVLNVPASEMIQRMEAYLAKGCKSLRGERSTG